MKIKDNLVDLRKKNSLKDLFDTQVVRETEVDLGNGRRTVFEEKSDGEIRKSTEQELNDEETLIEDVRIIKNKESAEENKG
ncbi:hypothetical protein SOV_12700 [Sporomusa ovata DSM 2662]|uniref:Uncharacterized protein n=1 Tax=Sporomusa ovata TaxID=2378 RepID=A0A0U1L049_9FIRM|nr:hypothetical protein [Sporomusa ovata]EQB28880.1 hypothetical protein SOV_1c06060 [Sporomusa ovata DSM 2662]CQR72304.1 hypothetical protein SpAn4DRAFT_2764 [Sporomusa ovata]